MMLLVFTICTKYKYRIKSKPNNIDPITKLNIRTQICIRLKYFHENQITSHEIDVNNYVAKIYCWIQRF